MGTSRCPKQKAKCILLWSIIGFVCLQIGLAIAIESCLARFRDPYYAYKIRRLCSRLLHASDPPVTVVMLGSSRTAFGLRAADLEIQVEQMLHRPTVAFNFGMLGAGPVAELVSLRRLLATGVRPDLLLIEVLPPVLAGQVAQAEVNHPPAERLWLGEVSLLERFAASPTLRLEWWRSWPLPWYTHRYAILSCLAPAFLPYQMRQDLFQAIDDSGWVMPPQGKPNPDRYRAAVARARREYATYFQDFQIGGPSCRALREMLELAQREKIPTALVLMPEGSDFRGWYPSTAWTQIQSFLDSLSQDYAVPIINARQWISDEQFADSHHLVPNGAALFTQRLGEESVAPLLEETMPGSWWMAATATVFPNDGYSMEP